MSYMKDEEQLKATLYRMEESFGEKTSALTCKHLSKMDELRNNVSGF